MDLKNLKKELHPRLYEYLSARYESLRPPQALAVKAGLLKGKNLVVASPTASGKTLIAELLCVDSFLKNEGKSVYIVPLKALATEKYESFKRYSELGLRVGVSYGDFDSDDKGLSDKDVIIVTSEKFDSLLRHGVQWIHRVKNIIIDEVHLINDAGRGPTLEVLITRLKTILPNSQFVALSATIKNSDEIAGWLDAVLVKSSYRPVPLRKGVLLNNDIFIDDQKISLAPSSFGEASVIMDTLRIKKQVLFFLSTKRFTESLAKNSKRIVNKLLTEEEKKDLNLVSEKIKNVLESPTTQCELLSECISGGVAFHHSGLLLKQRDLIENYFRKGLIKVICSTTSLALGVNLPAYRVVVRDLKRYSDEGSDWIPVLEFEQMIGRAGRPDYDSEGEGIALVRNESDLEFVKNRFIKGDTEEIFSKLSVEPVLRMHVLALIADRIINDHDSLMRFFSKTFFAYQFKDLTQLDFKIKKVVNELIEYEFINPDYSITLLGKRVAQLYLDPFTAHEFIKGLIKASKKTDLNSLSFLQLICSSLEMRPYLRVGFKEFPEIEENIIINKHYLLTETPGPWDYDFESFIKSYKTALLLNSWIEEVSDQELLKEFKVPPGNLRSYLANADWLLYSLTELAKLINFKHLIPGIMKLRTRVLHGIKKELVPLVMLRNIGRVRARILFNNNINNVKDLRDAGLEKISKLLGSKTALSIMKQLS